MKKAVIWDLDGTLLDSYDVIVESIFLVFQELGYHMSRDKIKEYAICDSSNALFRVVAEELNVPVETLLERYRQISRSQYTQIKLMNGAQETLQALQDKGTECHVFTHRGTTTVPVLTHLGVQHYFGEILTSVSGFARKPDPEAILYLMEKYGLSRENTYYVGDRGLDIACANNAGIGGILFRREGDLDVSNGTELHIISELPQLLDLI